MKLVFDIGMFDGTDTAYYLESGFSVVAVEANPQLADAASRRFQTEIQSGRLTIVNAAITEDGGPVDLILTADLGASSVYEDWAANRRPRGRITVPGTTLKQLMSRYGCPEFIKVDIEGADRLCVLPLTANTRPAFLSFEAGNDVGELLDHCASIGYRRFKIINQISFRELANERSLSELLSARAMFYMGYKEPLFVRRAGRFFRSGHSSGPLPWQSDGTWRSAEETRERIGSTQVASHGSRWFDVHVTS
jgi:FkbM family methyltransferase